MQDARPCPAQIAPTQSGKLEGFGVRIIGWVFDKEGGVLLTAETAFSCPTLLLHAPHCRWEDGQKVERVLDQTERWAMHAADEVQLTIGGVILRIKQQPHALTGSKVGVGACLW